jgi:hypothetical protein
VEVEGPYQHFDVVTTPVTIPECRACIPKNVFGHPPSPQMRVEGFVSTLRGHGFSGPRRTPCPCTAACVCAHPPVLPPPSVLRPLCCRLCLRPIPGMIDDPPPLCPYLSINTLASCALRPCPCSLRSASTSPSPASAPLSAPAPALR